MLFEFKVLAILKVMLDNPGSTLNVERALYEKSGLPGHIISLVDTIGDTVFLVRSEKRRNLRLALLNLYDKLKEQNFQIERI